MILFGKKKNASPLRDNEEIRVKPLTTINPDNICSVESPIVDHSTIAATSPIPIPPNEIGK